MATSTLEKDLAKSLKDHAVSVRIGNLEACPFCFKDDFKHIARRTMHIGECILNPKREMRGEVQECPKCHVDIAKRAWTKHVDACNGDAEKTRERIQIREQHNHDIAVERRDAAKKVIRATKRATKMTTKKIAKKTAKKATKVGAAKA